MAPPREILLGKSRRINVGLVEDGTLRMSREARDWGPGHAYGICIARQEVIRSGRVLAVLERHPHPNLMTIQRFDDDWVWVEHIQGGVLDGRSRYTPAQDRRFPAFRDVVADHTEVLAGVRAALTHLHGLGIAHTDVTGFNVMVNAAGVAKLIDLLGCVPLTAQLQRLDWALFAWMERQLGSPEFAEFQPETDLPASS